MNTKIIRLNETDSTNRYLRDYTAAKDYDITFVTAKYQTAGKGMGKNTWESAANKNLLFSVLVRPTMLPVNKQFLLSMAHALSVKETLDKYTDGITIKWPNDVYYGDNKISGTRIDVGISACGIRQAIIGTGINVNQHEFFGNAPNPVSLVGILGHEVAIDDVLNNMVHAFNKYYAMIVNAEYANIAAFYHRWLYRAHGFYTYRDINGELEAAIMEVEDNGRIVLRDRKGKIRTYAFKEIQYKI